MLANDIIAVLDIASSRVELEVSFVVEADGEVLESNVIGDEGINGPRCKST